MFRMRPVKKEDVNFIFSLANLSTGGVYSLPKDIDLLQSKIDRSLKAFNPNVTDSSGGLYLFVMENLTTKEVIGTAGILSKVGEGELFFAYHIGKEKHKCTSLGIEVASPVLTFCSDRKNTSELRTLFLSPLYRHAGLGRLLSHSRLLFIKAFPQRFQEKTMADMRGYVDSNGKNLFWEYIGRHFYGVDLPTAEKLVTTDKQCLMQLTPKNPIYISLLPQEAQKVIGLIHPHTQAAVKLLEEEGFSFSGEVNAIDGGPIIVAETNQIRTIRETMQLKVDVISDEEEPQQNHTLISNGKPDFRICYGTWKIESGKTTITKHIATLLEIQIGDTIFCAP